MNYSPELIEIASINGYRDMEWAINKYKSQFNVSYKLTSTPNTSTPSTRTTELSSEVF